MAAGPTHAVVAPVDLHVIHGADAGVVADGVVAVSGPADAGLLALVDICRQSRPPEAAYLSSETPTCAAPLSSNFSCRISSRYLQYVKKKHLIPGAEHHYSGHVVKWSPRQRLCAGPPEHFNPADSSSDRLSESLAAHPNDPLKPSRPGQELLHLRSRLRVSAAGELICIGPSSPTSQPSSRKPGPSAPSNDSAHLGCSASLCLTCLDDLSQSSIQQPDRACG